MKPRCGKRVARGLRTVIELAQTRVPSVRSEVDRVDAVAALDYLRRLCAWVELAVDGLSTRDAPSLEDPV